jgi:hypothetical protein
MCTYLAGSVTSGGRGMQIVCREADRLLASVAHVEQKLLFFEGRDSGMNVFKLGRELSGRYAHARLAGRVQSRLFSTSSTDRCRNFAILCQPYFQQSAFCK